MLCPFLSGKLARAGIAHGPLAGRRGTRAGRHGLAAVGSKYRKLFLETLRIALGACGLFISGHELLELPAALFAFVLVYWHS